MSAKLLELGLGSAVDSNGRTMFVAAAHRADCNHFVVRADEKLTAFLELESAVHEIKHDEIRSGQHLHWRNRFA